MNKRKTYIFSALFCVCLSYAFYVFHVQKHACECTQIYMLNVGQGTALYIVTESGKETLIDTGETHKILRELGKLRSPLDRYIDYIFITHGDRDHIGRLPTLLDRLSVGVVVTNGRREETVFSDLLSRSGVETAHVGVGDAVIIDEIEMKVLWPESPDSGSRNEASLVILMSVGDTKVLITGDVSKSVEKKLVQTYGDGLRSDILVVAHHGSKSSTAREFLESVRPKAALISAGAGNRHGHPHESVTSLLNQLGINTYRTDTQGTIKINFSRGGFDIIVQ